MSNGYWIRITDQGILIGSYNPVRDEVLIAAGVLPKGLRAKAIASYSVIACEGEFYVRPEGVREILAQRDDSDGVKAMLDVERDLRADGKVIATEKYFTEGVIGVLVG